MYLARDPNCGMCCSWLNPRWRNITLSTHCGVGDERVSRDGGREKRKRREGKGRREKTGGREERKGRRGRESWVVNTINDQKSIIFPRASPLPLFFPPFSTSLPLTLMPSMFSLIRLLLKFTFSRAGRYCCEVEEEGRGSGNNRRLRTQRSDK